MQHRLGFALSLIAAALLWGPTSASAQQEIIDLGPGYAVEGSRVVDTHISTAGDSLTIVGHVIAFRNPFLDLDPNDPAKEYTYVYRGLVSQGTTNLFNVIFTTNYSGGVLEIYCDTAQDADFADKTTFMNGDMILSATLLNFTTVTKTSNVSGSQNADIAFTGGSLVNRLVGCTSAIITGAFSVYNGFVPAAQQAQGYFGFSDTKIDAQCPTPVDASSWGRIKLLHR